MSLIGTARNDITPDLITKNSKKTRKRKLSCPDLGNKNFEPSVSGIYEDKETSNDNDSNLDPSDMTWIPKLKIPRFIKIKGISPGVTMKLVQIPGTGESQLCACINSVVCPFSDQIYHVYDDVVLKNSVISDSYISDTRAVSPPIIGKISEIYLSDEQDIKIVVFLYLSAEQIKSAFNCQPKSTTLESENYFTDQNFKNQRALYATGQTETVGITDLKRKCEVLVFSEWCLRVKEVEEEKKNECLGENECCDYETVDRLDRYFSAGMFKCDTKSIKTHGKSNEKLEPIQQGWCGMVHSKFCTGFGKK